MTIHKHPFPGGWFPNRLDMGYDGTFLGDIASPFDGHVIYAGVFNGWNGSHGIIIKAAHHIGEGVPTNCLYFTEGVRPLVTSGKRIRAGEFIAAAADSPYGNSYGHGALGAIEWGVADDGPTGQQTNAYAINLGVGSAAARDMVLRFAQWAHNALGVALPSSTDHAGRP